MARKMKHVGNRDRNEPEIVAEFERLGFYVIRMPRDAGFDLLCIGIGNILIVEVKKPSTILDLTDAELNLSDMCRLKGVDYWIVQSAEFVKHIVEERL